jgi:hypothetical protein
LREAGSAELKKKGKRKRRSKENDNADRPAAAPHSKSMNMRGRPALSIRKIAVFTRQRREVRGKNAEKQTCKLRQRRKKAPERIEGFFFWVEESQPARKQGESAAKELRKNK